jgi:IS30 family transposase
MARVLKRCRSTIFRELKRNHFSDKSLPGCDGYFGAAAHIMQADRNARERKLIKQPKLFPVQIVIGKREVERGEVMLMVNGKKRAVSVQDLVAAI